MADVAASAKEGAPPAIITGSPVASAAATSAVDEANGTVTTASNARHGRKTFSPGGHYADPLSPIASTPLKRQRVHTAEKAGKSSAKPGGGSSVKKQKQQEDVSTPAVIGGTNGSAPNGSASDAFFSPRKLVNEYDAEMEMKTDEQMSKESSAAASPRATSSSTKHSEHGDSDAASGDDGPNSELFSPMLKPPSRSATKTSSDPSPSSSHSKIDASLLSSSSTCSERNDGEEETTTVTSTTVISTIVTIESEELEEDDEATYGVGSESGSEGSLAEQEFNPFYFMKTLPKYEEIVSCPRPIVLPAKSRNAPKISLVLDLDETLVHCSVDDVANPHLQFPVNFNGVEYTVKVKKRPHMEYFLKRVSQLFEVVVFTASHRAYAETLLNLLDPHRNLIKYRLYRDDCLDVYGNYLKDLNVLGRNLATVLLVDNSPHAFGYQVNNGVPIETWYDDEGDDELLNLLPFLESLVDVDDVRPIVEKQFQIQKLIDATPDEVV